MKKRGNSNSKKQISKQTTKKQKEQRVFKPLKDLTLGSSVTGKVVEVCEFGAFVDIGYASRGSRPGTALLHVSQIQDGKVSNVTDVINKGDTIEDARVIKVDYVKGEVGISLRKRRPKRKDISEFKVRDKLIGRVDSVVPYGAFIDIGANVNPLLHISRITGSAIDNIRHYVNEGDSVPVHVIDIDVEKKTMAVSMLDKKADQYLDRRLSQKKRKFFGTAKEEVVEVEVEDESELDYFDKAIQELEVALRGK
jgi:ribosomal protein S1